MLKEGLSRGGYKTRNGASSSEKHSEVRRVADFTILG